MIRLNDIVVKFGDFTALHSINVHVKEGEFFTFLGPSGCGKTTTLRTITGFIEPAEGSVVVKGRDITRVPIEDRNIGIVFQSYALFPTMTVYDNIAFGLKVKKAKKDEIDRKVREIARKVDLSDEQLKKAVSQLSGGQQQRVAIARALVTGPAIICMDEPLSNLDAKLRVQLRNELKKMQKDFGITTIYVTHDQTEAMTMADHIVLMRDGHIMQQGTPNDLYDHPANEFVAGFLGTPQINIFSCTVKGDVLDGGSFQLKIPEHLKKCLAPYVGKKVDLGIRPSDFELTGDTANAIRAHVDSIEPLGDAYLIYVRVGEKVVVFKYAGETAPKEQELLLTPNMAKLHLFDPETEKRINE